MKFLGYKECEYWLESHGYPTYLTDLFEDRHEGDWTCYRFRIALSASVRVAMVKALWASLVRDQTSVFIFPKIIGGPRRYCAHLPLFMRLRESLGERRPYHETPGMICSPEQHEDGLSTVVLSCLFAWDCYLLPQQPDWALLLSHDDYCVLLLSGGVQHEPILQATVHWHPATELAPYE